MKEAYVSYEVAKLLKDKGFDWGCSSYWCVFPNGDIVHTDYGHFANHNGDETDRFISRPTQQMACKWLSEVHNADIWVRPQTGILGVKGYTPYVTTYKLRTKGHMYYHEDEPDRYDSKDHFIPVPDDKGLIPAHQHYSKHEDAVEAALQYALTNLIEQ